MQSTAAGLQRPFDTGRDRARWHRGHVRAVDKLVDIVGLYMNPLERALVVCFDETQKQAMDRTQLGVQLNKGRCGTRPTTTSATTLLAALSLLDGQVIGACMTRHRHQEFIRFRKKIDDKTSTDLVLHLIVDHDANHTPPARFV